MNSEENIKKIQNHFIITKQRSGSTLLGFILSGGENIHVVHEENTHFKLYDKYKSKIFDNKTIVYEFLEDFYHFPTHFSIHKYYIPDRNKLTEWLLENIKFKYNYREFCNLFYLSFFSVYEEKNIKTIINKDILYHSSVEKIYTRDKNSKFIFLVRDVVSNISSHVKRNMLTTNPLAHAFIWECFMQKIIKLTNYLPDENFIIIKYEDLIADTEKTIRKICNFLQVPYTESMLKHKIIANKKFNYVYNRMVMEEGGGPLPFLDEIHSESKNNLNTNKINENEFGEKELNKIYRLTNTTRVKLGYKSVESKPLTFYSALDLFHTFRLSFIYLIFTIYHQSGYSLKIFYRKINIFKFFNK